MTPKEKAASDRKKAAKEKAHRDKVSQEKAAATRIRVAKERGAALVRRMNAMAEVSTEPLLALVDAFAALYKEYPDVYANPPVPLETLRQHAEELRVAEEAVKRDQAAEAAATKALDERLRALGRGPGEAEAVVALRKLEDAKKAYSAAFAEIGAALTRGEKLR